MAIESYAHEQAGSLGVEIGNYTMRTARDGTVIDVGRYPYPSDANNPAGPGASRRTFP
jgi:hypothetical protein